MRARPLGPSEKSALEAAVGRASTNVSRTSHVSIRGGVVEIAWSPSKASARVVEEGERIAPRELAEVVDEGHAMLRRAIRRRTALRRVRKYAGLR